ncbi:MAG: CADD family putative folate metabolism protein [Proteobacteria bacterium]|nr:CADD family putative folate metabolism protein [Pseudomonadota bacterium]
MIFADDFCNEIEAQLEPYDLLNHPFYQAWSNGALELADLQDYAAQYYHHVFEFPAYLARLYATSRSTKQRKVLAGNFAEEAVGTDNHPDLWLRFAEGLGLAREAVKDAVIKEHTQRLIDGYNELAGNCPRGIGALYAYERQTPAIAQSKIEGLKKFYNIGDVQSLQFFTTHIEADKWHSDECRALVVEMSPAEQEEAKVGAVAGAKLLWQFLDGCTVGQELKCAAC